MEFRFETAYDQKAITAMAKALRKTIRKKRSRRSHILGYFVLVLALLLTLPLGGGKLEVDFRAIITWLAALCILFTFIFEDRLNAYVARKRMLPGLQKAVVTFGEETYFSETEIGNSEFKYDNILMLAETENYVVFVFSQSHAQVYDKKTIEGGTIEDFRIFISRITGKEIISI